MLESFRIMTERDINTATDHDRVIKARKELQSKVRIPVRQSNRIGDLTTGNHVTFNLQEEIDMYKKFGFSRIKEVYVRKQNKGKDILERYTPDGEYSVYPDLRGPYEKSEVFKGKKVCGQEILVFRSFQANGIVNNLEMYPETQIPNEFKIRETEALLEKEL